MSNNKGITDDVRKREEEYFRRQDRELVEKMRQAEAAAKMREALGTQTGIHDEACLGALEALGFTVETCALLPMIPLVQTAWAAEGVSASERAAIVKLARTRGIEAGTAADHQLTSWLDRRPSDDMFHKANRLIAAMMEQPGNAVTDLNPDELMKYCEDIAQASGGIFGIGRVSAAERAVLDEIAAELKNR